MNTEFTEFSIDTQKKSCEELQRNVSEKSVVFCPFNSVIKQSELAEEFKPLDFRELVLPRRVLKFSSRVKEVNRAYERFNNLDFDNGVYHKFAYKNQPKVERKPSTKAQGGRKAQDLNKLYQQVNLQVVNEMEAKLQCWSSDHILCCLKRNDLNSCTATYYLLQFDQNF